jgi:hypothetical protein
VPYFDLDPTEFRNQAHHLNFLREHGLINTDRCKDTKGNWTYWVIERCTSEQLEKYYQLLSKIANESFTFELAENELLKNLNHAG